MESALLELAREGGPDDEVSVIVRLRNERDVPPHLRVVARFGLIATGRIRRRDIDAVRAVVASMKRPQEYSPAWEGDWEDEGDEDLNIRPGDLRRVEGMPTGRGTIICHLDWGIDICHASFRRPDGSTRLLALWDQGRAYDPRYPNGYGIGRIFLRDEINRALASADPYGALAYKWWSSDRGNGSHGSHTLGISAGRELEGLPAGFAPDADLIFVDLTTQTAHGAQPLGSSTDLLEGCDFADRTAGDRPLVINASLGRQAGQHDGLTLTEQALDQFVNRRDCCTVVMSGGNYFAKSAHSQLTILPGETRVFHLVLAEGSTKAELDLWYPRADILPVRLEGPDGIVVGPLGPDQHSDIVHNGRTIGRCYERSDDPNNGDSQVSLFFYEAAPAGEWRLVLDGLVVGDGRVHAWVERNPTGTSRLKFAEPDVETSSTTGTICNGYATIAVAAYDAHSPGREPGRFSSAGPTRDGRSSRPTLAAPGVKVLSARSRPRGRSETPLQSRMSGTSMAAPHVTGLIALLYEAAPRPIGIEEVRALLVDTADAVAENERHRLGAGYLNPAAAVTAARALSSHAPVHVHPGPSLVPRPQLRLPSAKESEMTMSETPIEAEDEVFECDADYDAELEAVLSEGAEAAEQSIDQEVVDSAEGYRRGGPAPLPFQFQIPIGGSGGLGLAVPIGGRASPFALSVPLTGSTPAVPPTVQLPPGTTVTATAPGTAPDPGVTTALDLPDPLSAAAAFAADSGELEMEECERCGPECECDAQEDEAALAEALQIEQLESGFASLDFSDVDQRYASEQVMAAATTAIDSAPESSSALVDALGEALMDSDSEADGADQEVVSLLDLFRSIVAGDRYPRRLFGRYVRVLARPGEPLGRATPLRGDLLVRASPAQRWAQLSFVASDALVSLERLAELGLRPEAPDSPLPGRYVQVIEAWPLRHDEQDCFARRITNAADLLPLDTLLLRLLPSSFDPESENVAEEDNDPNQPRLSPGSRGSAVSVLQHRLNQLHARRTESGLAGLPNMPLFEDGVFGPRVKAAVEAMQRLAPSGIVPVPTGIMDLASWRALALLEATSALVSPVAAQIPRSPSPQPSGLLIPAGQETIEHVPLLAVHRGTPPDLIFRWNAMTSAPERVDVVVHLHGFSGVGPAMRIDRDKLPKSGLDFVNPDNPAEPGRSVPTIGVLPRGNFYGGQSHMGYDFPALFATGALEQLIGIALDGFAASAGVRRPGVGRLILTAHSGGGAALMHLLRDHDPDEIHSFDALYNSPANLIRWAQARLHGANPQSAALRVLYRAGEGTAANSRDVGHALQQFTATDPQLARRFRVEATREPHNGIPRRYGWTLLADAGSDVDLSLAAHASPVAPSHGGSSPVPTPARPQQAAGPRPSAVSAPDADTLRRQWDANPGAHQYFDNSEDRYVEFGPLFAQRGVGDAAAYLANNMTTLDFLGRHQPGHRDLATPLRSAERALTGQTIAPPVTSFGCLNVRRIAGTDRLSFHALGRAIDLNPSTNPHVKSAADFLVIHAVTGVDLRHEAHPARLQEASRTFQRDFNEQWIATQNDSALVAALAGHETRQRLLGYAQRGFCTLYLPLIEALLAAGLRWGGSWSTSKDFMHFELP